MSQDLNRWQEAFWEAALQAHGVCGHCGKKKCGGRASHVVMPTKLLPLLQPISDELGKRS